MKIRLLFSTLFAIPVSSYASEEKNPSTTLIRFDRIADLQKTVELGVGEKLRVELWGNPVLGSRWVLQPGSSDCLPTETGAYIPDSPNAPSLGGTWTFDFTTSHCCGVEVGIDYSDEAELQSASVNLYVQVVASEKARKEGDECNLVTTKSSEVLSGDRSWFV